LRYEQAREALSGVFQAAISAVSFSGDAMYAGAADGRLWVSLDRGRTWSPSFALNEAGPVTRIWVDPKDPRVALASFGSRDGARRPMIARTLNGGVFWDDLSSNLPPGKANGVVADRASGTIFAATAKGLFYTTGDLQSLGPATAWVRIAGNLPDAPVVDVALDEAGTQLYVALHGYGLYAANAPHRARVSAS
jgi:photosystem II stability/assembly factor-like uncharacterized protein